MRLSVHKHRGVINLRQLIIGLFVCWPFFYSLWTQYSLTTRIFGAMPTVILWGLAVISVIMFGRLYKDVILLWLLFFGVTLLLCWKANKSAYFIDLSIELSALLICYTAGKQNVDGDRVFRCLKTIGLFVGVTVILDATLRLFSVRLVSLYTSAVIRIITSRTAYIDGGIFFQSGIAGCFIIPGLLAYIISYQKKKKSAYFWIGLSILVLSTLLINKRGFVIDVLVAFIVLRLINRRAKGKVKLNINKLLLGVFSVIAAVIVLVVLYQRVPFIRQSFSNMFDKFANDNGSLSGRTSLYDLAWRLFKQHPLTGIGWGNFRSRTLHIFSSSSATTFEAHNVYLQLLCETGIFGLLSFLAAVIGVLVHTIRRYIKVFGDVRYFKTEQTLKLSVYLQIFFIAYCMSGNPLYDAMFIVSYFVGVLLLGVNTEETALI